ncbi:hypothetical protein [Pseudobdellovibrio exovorus]|uniref:HhH-GPD domain-containing protein n=1 Tax=Pseudobdellovibrio exovorus JSS TaxID=1184267 RepID=M4V4Q2_9BACT|nr:hypothetical protein [Pseudobdellovibrio exovorus]AGH94317.1 hypothetical protein A11Q_97 [Pseudobdellovibrio exovorus JSS]
MKSTSTSKLVSRHKSFVELNIPNYPSTIKLKVGKDINFGSAAYWIYQWHSNPEKIQKTGRSLSQEILACMLGGYGITGELSNAYYEKITSQVSDLSSLNSSTLEAILRSPVLINGRNVKYRYPTQKARQISAALNEASAKHWENLAPLALRESLLNLTGIGLKTASWIVRNYTASDEVAIIDIHLHRAGVLAGFFLPEWTPTKHYKLMESAFISFSKKFNLSASGLDLLIWNHMRIRKFTHEHLNSFMPKTQYN